MRSNSPIVVGFQEILHQLIGGKHLIVHRVSTIKGGSGFLPSTVSTAEAEIGCSVAIAEHLRQELYVRGFSAAAASTTWV